tara:strand:+ start:227 stop:928 length:702 start_codon:yes stop_codon:yes gene_type:complete
MDVTKGINRSIELMGGSGSTNPTNYAATKSLNYAKSKNSITNAAIETVTAIPYTLKYKDAVGLFGAENVFVKVQLNIQSATTAFTNINIPENDYLPVWTFAESGTTNFYDTGEFSFGVDNGILNDFEPSTISNDLSAYSDPYVRIDLANLKTGNIYVDNWFDVRIYTADRIEYAYDTIYLPIKGCFYIGFHARNTRRLPYNVEVTIGNEYLNVYDLSSDQRRLTVSPQQSSSY